MGAAASVTRDCLAPSLLSANPQGEVATRSLNLRQGPYCLRLASSAADRMDAFRLRFLVFNLELNEGLDAAYTTGHDIDEFDAICDHLVVEHAPTGKIVGTYRLQTGAMAFENAGFYSEREFDFSPYKRLGNAVIELGRACVHRDHRSTDVLYLLWRGIAQYAISHGGRYLIGCSSLTSQDPAHGTAVYEAMREHLADRPTANHAAARLRHAPDIRRRARAIRSRNYCVHTWRWERRFVGRRPSIGNLRRSTSSRLWISKLCIHGCTRVL